MSKSGWHLRDDNHDGTCHSQIGITGAITIRQGRRRSDRLPFRPGQIFRPRIYIPFAMITSSKVQKDVDRAHELGAVGYLVKPVSLEDLKELFTETAEFLALHPA